METPISLSQIGLYNPQRQSAAVTEALFVARQKHFDLLLNKIAQEKENSIPQQYLIIGQRGMGKTTLLKRIEVELHKPPYRQRFIPLLFPEEQYNIKDLAVFWVNCLDALADSLESENKEQYDAQISDIDKTIRELSGKTSKVVSEDVYHYFMGICRDLQRRPVLLVDNIGFVFCRLGKDKNDQQGQWALRKLLSENGAPVIISAGHTVTDDTVNYDMPFYDFFQMHYLKKLRFSEFTELLENLAVRTRLNSDITAVMHKEKPRLQTLYQFTGGNPRTAVMLFKLLVKGFSEDITDDLEALVDEVTPLYKAKLEELPPQQQVILDAVAMNWHAIPLKKLAQDTGLAANQLAPQLKRLLDDGWIETVEADKISREIKGEVEGVIKGNAYFISERFFNIWFLIRRSTRRQKKGVHCLSEFLECLYGPERLAQEADRFLQCEISSSRQLLRGLSFAESSLLDDDRKKKLKDKIYNEIWKLSEHEAEILEEFEIPRDVFIEKVKTLEINRLMDLTTQFKPSDIDFWNDIAFSLRLDRQYEKALVCLDKADLNDVSVWWNKYYILDALQRFEEAIVCLDKAIELSSENEMVWSHKGCVLFGLGRFEEAIDCYNKAIELAPEDDLAWSNKGGALNGSGRFEEAIVCLDKATELNSKNDTAWNNKGYALIELKNYEGAAFAYEKSRSIYPRNLFSKLLLVFLYRDKLNEMTKARELFNEIEQEIANDEKKKFAARYYLHKTLFELHNQNQGLAKDYLLNAFEALIEENKLSSIANNHWWEKFGSVTLGLGYGSWLLAILEEKGYDIELSPYYTAVQALDIEKQDSKNGQRDAEIYLKNRAVEISEPARMIIQKMKKYMD